MLENIRKVKDAVQDLVDKGVTSVQEIHNSIAQVTFEQAEKAAPEDLKAWVEPAKGIQESATGAVYDAIRKINGHVGTIADLVLDKVSEVAGEVATEAKQEGQETTSA